MSAVPATKLFSVEEYLQQEETAAEKSEYYRREKFIAQGWGVNHNRIVRNSVTALDNFLKAGSIEVLPYGTRLYVEANCFFAYPDLCIIDSKVDYWESKTKSIINPLVIIEVQSPATFGYDQGDKFKLYRDIPSLKEYILIASTEQMVQRYVKQAPHHWAFSDTRDAEGLFEVETIGFSCPVKELYRNVDFQQQ